METLKRSNTAQEIYDEITAYINSSPHNPSLWYVGITQNIDQRLFGAHNVSKNDPWWIYQKARTSTIARNVEKGLLGWGCDGGDGGGDSDALFIYAYLKTIKTRR